MLQFNNPETCIVIPSYNIEGNFLVDRYVNFLEENKKVLLCFVNDGSKDQTSTILEELRVQYKNQVHCITYQKNKGKAEAVRTGIQYCNNTFTHSFIGFLDVDLSTSLEEFMRLKSLVKGDFIFLFGSRIKSKDTYIIRKLHRHIIGRTISKVINFLLKMNIYDTQCGCKVFTKEISVILFKDKFVSTWLFDVELFFRIKKYLKKDDYFQFINEVPLKSWESNDNSNVKFIYFFKIWSDFYKIYLKYYK